MNKRAVQSAKRDVRAKQARQFINKVIPTILKSNARARNGVSSAELIVDPPSTNVPASARNARSPPDARHVEVDAGSNAVTSHRDELSPGNCNPRMNVSLRVVDTLEAAKHLLHNNADRGRVAVLNMASPLRPGGGVLNGATSQEEHICARTTLYPSLLESFYRLPEVGAIYTPDVLVCRSWESMATDFPASERFFVDVVTAAMLRMPDVEHRDEGLAYAHDKDRELVVRKMRAVMRILHSKGVNKVVLGAWGCGAYGNPVSEIGKAWRRVLCGGGRIAKRTGVQSAGRESWEGLSVVFAIKDQKTAFAFAEAFGVDVLAVEANAVTSGDENDEGVEEDGHEENTE